MRHFNLTQRKRGCFVILTLSVLLCLFLSTAFAEDPGHFEFSIDSIISVNAPYFAWVDISKTAGDSAIEGFDFLIAYDTALIQSWSLWPGEAYDANFNYEWEYLSFVNYHNNLDCDGCPNGFYRVSGIADTGAGDEHPISMFLEDSTGLFRLRLRPNIYPINESVFAPIYFFWKDCGDNSIAYVNADTSAFALSDSVIDSYHNYITDANAAFPTPFGSPSECIDTTVPNPPIRLVNFKSGGLNIRPYYSPDGRGDINLNGVLYEAGDAEIYEAYFIEGLSAFTISQNLQSATADINFDSVYLSVPDLTYMHRIMDGLYPQFGEQQEPQDTISAGKIYAIETDSSIIIKGQFTSNIGSIQVGLYAPDIPDNAGYQLIIPDEINHMTAISDVQDDTLKILIYSRGNDSANSFINASHQIIAEVVTDYQKPSLSFVNAADYLAHPLDLAISIPDPEPIVINIGRISNVSRGDIISVPITIDASGQAIKSFDFTLRADPWGVIFLGAEPGELFDIPGAYEWEYFTYDIIQYDYPIFGDYPPQSSEFIHISAIANLDNGPHQPIQYIPDEETVLCYLNFRVSQNIAFTCNMLPFYFYWINCYDNQIILNYGLNSITAVSDDILMIYDADTIVITEPYNDLDYPSPMGLPINCFNSLYSADSLTFRTIDFYSGWVEILCDSTNEVRGDLNLNGIGYEIADWVTFSQYFTNGIQAFTISSEVQTTASDIDGDLKPLRVADHMFLSRIIDDSMNPGDQTGLPSYGSINFGGDDTMTVINGHFLSDVSGLFVEFYAPNLGLTDIVLSPDLEHLNLSYQQIDDYLRVFISDTASNGPENGSFDVGYRELFTINHQFGQGVNVIVNADAADYYGKRIDLNIDGQDLNDRGDVNLNGITYEIADHVVFTNFFLYGLSAFTINVQSQMYATEINGDGVVLGIQDLVYLRNVILGNLLPIDFAGFNYEVIDAYCDIIQTDSSYIVRIESEDSLGGAYLSFGGANIQPEDYHINFYSIDSNLVGHNAVADSINILIYNYDFFSNNSLTEPGIDTLFEIVFHNERYNLLHASASGDRAEYVDLQIGLLPNSPPIFDSIPSSIFNEYHGGFQIDLNAYAIDLDSFPDRMRYDLIYGPGEVDSETGKYTYGAICEDQGSVYHIGVCLSDRYHECDSSGTAQFAEISLEMNNAPPLLGDVSGNGSYGIEDISCLIAAIYMDMSCAVPGIGVGEVDRVGTTNLLDIIYLINYMYGGGPAPQCN